MSKDLHPTVSGITEIPDFLRQAPWLHFGAAVMRGAMVGSLAIGVAIALLSPGNSRSAFSVALVVSMAAAAIITLAGMIVIGLPVTSVLKAADAEHSLLYAAVGFIAGFAILAAMMGTPSFYPVEALAFPLAGGLAGFATALRWGRWREALADYRRQSAAHGAPAPKRSNPIHELTH